MAALVNLTTRRRVPPSSIASITTDGFFGVVRTRLEIQSQDRGLLLADVHVNFLMKLSRHGLDYGGMLCSKKLSAQFSNAFIGRHTVRLTSVGSVAIQVLLYTLTHR